MFPVTHVEHDAEPGETQKNKIAFYLQYNIEHDLTVLSSFICLRFQYVADLITLLFCMQGQPGPSGEPGAPVSQRLSITLQPLQRRPDVLTYKPSVLILYTVVEEVSQSLYLIENDHTTT